MSEVITADKVKEEMDLARADVVSCEKEIQSIKSKIRELGSTAVAPDEANPNSLELVVLKVEGLPEAAKPSFILQLSSPVEEDIISKLFDPLDESAEGSVATFAGVEISTATLTISAKDMDIPLGVSVPQDVASLCHIKDVMKAQDEYVQEFSVAFSPEGAETAAEQVAETETAAQESKTSEAADAENEGEKAESKPTESATEPAAAEPATEPATEPAAEPTTAPATEPVVEPICRATFRAKYKPSPKDQREELYDLLNKASQKKSKALDRLRKSATMVSRLAPSSTTITAPSARTKSVQKGFLNKGKKPSKMMQWYNRNFGPGSMIRAVVPAVKNYVIFAVAVGFFHFKGQFLALPAPV
uniref:Uncharacterized protein n=1 Tax=Cyclophora tenuis TaxID=216820 RepID=A0A7S1DA58_CYCTE|mmetsp:Transcript_6252/g.10866  ORF Transcript_6252/g.10866 Transcript_6252/m.10866 type:complete len:360 (+) Transcript_6252:58-1137(+)